MPELYGLCSRRTNRSLLLQHRLSLVPTSAGNIRAQPEFIGVRRVDCRRDSLVAGQRPLFQREWSALLVLPMLYSYLAFSVVAPLALILTADLKLKPLDAVDIQYGAAAPAPSHHH
jgi:hypothetical protein